MLPLPAKSRAAFAMLTPQQIQESNKGLVFNRFFDSYPENKSSDMHLDANSLQQLVGSAGKTSELQKCVERHSEMLASLGGKIAVFNTQGPFVTGTGINHPAENGFNWHPTLGVPYLPGSSVKGLLRAWLEWQASEEEQSESSPTNDQTLISDWFGQASQAGEDTGKAGELIFFDALPVEAPTVGLDIMTPHMGKWYESGQKEMTSETIPADWHTPVPISFLVCKSAKLSFAIAPRSKKSQQWVDDALAQLEQALNWLGAGAKTAVGYGYMSFDEKSSQQLNDSGNEKVDHLQQQAQLDSLPPKQRSMQTLKNTIEQAPAAEKNGPGSTMYNHLKQFAHEASDWPADDKKNAALFVKEMLPHIGIPPGKMPKKVKEWLKKLT